VGRRARQDRPRVSGKRSRHARDKRPDGGFVPLPHIVLRSAQWASLSPFAVKLLMELLGQYRGDNNGDLTVAWTLMSKRGWKSRTSLAKAMRELEANRWIQRTRQGGRHVATLLAITIFALDDDNPKVRAKLGIPLNDYNRNAWAIGPVGPRCVPRRRFGGTPVGPIAPQLTRGLGQSRSTKEAIDTRAGPVEGVSQKSLARPLDTSIDMPSIGPGLAPPSPPTLVRTTAKTLAPKQFGAKPAETEAERIERLERKKAEARAYVAAAGAKR